MQGAECLVGAIVTDKPIGHAIAFATRAEEDWQNMAMLLHPVPYVEGTRLQPFNTSSAFSAYTRFSLALPDPSFEHCAGGMCAGKDSS